MLELSEEQLICNARIRPCVERWPDEPHLRCKPCRLRYAVEQLPFVKALQEKNAVLDAQLGQAQYNLKMLEADFALESKKKYAVLAENTRLLAAVEFARQGEHFPFCGMPPPEAMKSHAAHKVWLTAKHEACSTPEGRKAWWLEHCVCWKRKMELALVPKEEADGT